MASFAEQLRQITERRKAEMETMVKETVKDMGAQLVQGSPVKSGLFVNNWQYGEGSANRDASASADKSGKGSLSRIETGLEGWKPGATIFVTSSLPYSARIEYGWSEGAPSGVVGIVVANYANTIQRAIAKAKGHG